VANELATHESGHLVLLTLMDVVDDTVLVNKSIFSELQQNVLDLAVHKFGRISLLYPFVGRKNRLLTPPTIASIQEMDKIREATRYAHLLSSGLPYFSSLLAATDSSGFL
jgi:pumilio family protein 6